MRADQLPLLTRLSPVSVDPTGSWAVVSATRPDFDADAYVGQLWRVPLDGGAPHRITRGFRDTAPQVSPDGSLIGFLRAEPGGRPQVAVVDAAGGEPMVVTDAALGVASFAFSPDATRIVYAARVPAEGRYGTVDDVGPGQEDPRRFTGNKIRANGLGWFNDRRSQLFWLTLPAVDAEPPVRPVGRAAKARAAAAEGPADPAYGPAAKAGLVPPATRLVTDDSDWHDPAFTADGLAVVATAAAHEGREDDLVSDLYRIDLADPEPIRLTRDAEPAGVQGACPAGDLVFHLALPLGPDGTDFVAHHPAVAVVAASGGPATTLTDASVTVDSHPVPAGDGACLVTDNHRGRGRALRVSAAGEVTWVLDDPTWSVLSVAARPGTDQVVAVVASATTPGEVAVVRDGTVTVLTDFAAPLRSATRVAEPVEVVAASRDGYPVHGWVVLPEGEGPHPVLLCVHGGPYASYGPTLFDEFQVYAEAGYAVVACNPRGSAGYGSEHGRAIQGRFGTLDLDDVLSFLEHCQATVDALDAERVGIMGGSYGGYLTAWAIAADHRFAGAIVERGFLDPWTFIGSSDIGWFFPQAYNGRDREQMDPQSPMVRAGEVRTPTLVLHSEDDLRCPLPQALQYYTLLKQAGVDAELLVFPGEDHELSRSGTPWHRRQRFEAILDFWSRRLPVV